MNYQIIADQGELEKFLGMLPDEKPNEQYYITLMARKKYLPGGFLTADKSLLKRVTSTKDRIIPKLRQMECAIGAYTFKGIDIPQEALACYITPNPRDLTKAGLKLLGAIADKVYKGEIYNPKSLALNLIQISSTNKKWYDVDVDIKRGQDSSTIHFQGNLKIKDMINYDCLTFVQTHGGFHMLIETSKVQDKYKNTWHKAISQMGNELYDITMNGDNLIPIPGTYQGGKIVRIL